MVVLWLFCDSVAAVGGTVGVMSHAVLVEQLCCAVLVPSQSLFGVENYQLG